MFALHGCAVRLNGRAVARSRVAPPQAGGHGALDSPVATAGCVGFTGRGDLTGDALRRPLVDLSWHELRDTRTPAMEAGSADG